MAILAGPILHFRGLQGSDWCTSALVVTTGDPHPPGFTVHSNTPVKCHLLKKIHCHYTFNDEWDMRLSPDDQIYHVWRFDWAVKQKDNEQRVVYSVDDIACEYVVPGSKDELRIAYGSCFDFSPSKSRKGVNNKYAIWTKLLNQHRQPDHSYHLLFMGGDQVYADRIWKEVRSMRKWLTRWRSAKYKSSPGIEEEASAFYLKLYLQCLSEKASSEACRQIPTLMMWDDHDIVDGWGSRSEEQQNSDVYIKLYKIAREYFCLFQLQSVSGNEIPGLLLRQQQLDLLKKQSGNLTFAYTIGEICLLALDLRSQRTRKVVMESDAWCAVWEWLEKNANHCRHLLVMSSVPVGYLNIKLMEKFFQWLPGEQSFENSIIDRWSSRQHEEERRIMIKQFRSFSEENHCRITFVSGDVHSAAVGYISSSVQNKKGKNPNRMYQVVSSAVVNVPPSALILYLLDRLLGHKADRIDRDNVASLLKFTGSNRRFLAARNFLSITLLKDKTLRNDWFVEDEKGIYTLLVRPVEPE